MEPGVLGSAAVAGERDGSVRGYPDGTCQGHEVRVALQTLKLISVAHSSGPVSATWGWQDVAAMLGTPALLSRSTVPAGSSRRSRGGKSTFQQRVGERTEE